MQAYEQKKKKKRQPWKSFYLSFRRHFPCCCPSSLSEKPPSILANSEHYKKKSLRFSQDDQTAKMQHWRRISELERELAELEEWLHTELARLRSRFRISNYFNRNNNNNRGEVCVNKGTKFDGRLERLDTNGDYCYHLENGMVLINEAYHDQDLAIHFSPPILLLPEFGSTMSEVLKRMARMGKENIITFLLDTSPMINISNNNKPQEHTTTPLSRAPKDFQEATFQNAVSKLGELVTYGLRMQKGVIEAEEMQQWRRDNVEGKNIYDHECLTEKIGGFLMAMLIQLRDPQKEYQLVEDKSNEVIVGFVEAEDDEEKGVVIKKFSACCWVYGYKKCK